MSLIGNYSLQNRVIGRKIGGSVSLMNNEDYSPTSSRKNRLSSFGKISGTPPSYLAPISWVLPDIGGAMGSFDIFGITGSGAGAAGRNLEAPSSASITLTNAELQQIVTLVATQLIIFSSNADLRAAVQMQASAILALATTANIQAMIDIMVSGNIAITPSGILTALAHMNAEAGGPTPLSPEGLAEAVWSKDITGYTDVNSAGRKLNDAGGAGNPWSADLASNNTVGTFGYLVQKLLTVAKFLGLK